MIPPSPEDDTGESADAARSVDPRPGGRMPAHTTEEDDEAIVVAPVLPPA